MLKMFTRKEGQKGFTLIELMIVVAIIGILAAIAIPQFSAYRNRGFKATMQADAKNVHTAVQAYLVDNPAKTAADINASPDANACTTAQGNNCAVTAGAVCVTSNKVDSYAVRVDTAGAITTGTECN